MVDNDIPKYAALLRQLYLFRGLSEADIAHVVTRFQRKDWKEGDVVLNEGDIGESFYVIYAGQVRVTRQQGQTERRLDDLGPGDHFGEEALLFDRPRSATIRATSSLVTLQLERDEFIELLETYPDMRLNLSATAESRHLAQRVHFDWLSEDEVIYLVARKHEFFLILSLLLPIFIGLGGIVFFALGVASSIEFFIWSEIEIGVALLVIAVLWGIWNWVDWGNDYYIVTSQRVVWLERVVIFYYSRREAPMTRVLSVNVNSSLIGQILHYGDVEVRTFTGGIRMRNCSNPHRFAHYVESFKSRAKEQLKKEEAALIERELRLQLGLEKPAPAPPVPQEPSLPEPPSRKPARPGSWREKLDTFLRTRYELNGVITYRKHLLVLLWKTWLPLLVFFSLLAGTIFLFVSRILTTQAWAVELPVLFFLGLLHLAAFLWWGYNYLDWSNDIYQLTPEQILDIERKPLGEEIKKSAPLDSILSLEHSREGIIQLIFNYGNVIINVGQTQFIFRGVTNPDDVHKDIADAIETLQRKKEEASSTRDRQRLVEWFSTYNRQSQILEEQKKESDWDIFPG
jgi:hypothetical protein